MQRSSNVDFHNLSSFHANFDDSDSGSDSPESSSKKVRHAPMFANFAIRISPESNTVVPFVMRPDEFEIVNVETPLYTGLPCHVEPIEGVVVHAAHLEQFPKPASPYSASLPCVFAWIDAHTTFSSEYSSSIHLYYKTCYSVYRSTLRMYFALAPSRERLETMEQLRREIPTGRICYHYVGYGFPTISEKGIWCSERRSCNFELFSLETLFAQFPPPTWFIFDCNNAGVVLNVFEQAEARNSQVNPGAADWSDWLCICASREGEKLPNDPRLPKDFLTSTVLQPIKTAIVCHILQHYRLTLVGDRFPLELPLANLFDSKRPETNMLMQALAAVTDGIAADSLSHELYHKIFRCERLTSTIFRHFLLAQYLLRPYRVHPVSHPTIPDLSRHPLWRQWSILLDTAICASAASPPSYATDLFMRSATSFEVFLTNQQFDLIRPYHFTLLYHMLAADQEREEPLLFLAEYASNPEASTSMLVNSAVFNILFERLVCTKRTSAALHPLCYLVAKLLYLRPQFASEFRKDIEISSFPENIFAQDLHDETRILCAAVVANLAICHEKLQHICTSDEFLIRTRNELQVCSAERALWLLMVIRRAFHLYSPDPASYLSNGIHLQCAMFLTSPSPLVRATAISVLCSFLRPFECPVNGHHLFLSLMTVFDASYLVRFQLLLLVKKFVMSFDSPPPEVSCEFASDTVVNILNSLYFTKDKPLSYFTIGEQLVSQLDELFCGKKFIEKAYQVALFTITMFSKDPHPTISSIASGFLDFLAKQKAAGDEDDDWCSCSSDDSYETNQLEREHLYFANLDQNQSLHFIVLRDLLEKRVWRAPDTDVTPLLTDYNQELLSEQVSPRLETESVSPSDHHVFESVELTSDPIKFLRVRDDMSIVAVSQNKVIFYKDGETPVSRELPGEATDLILLNHGKVAVATSNGCCHIWQPSGSKPVATFRVSPQLETQGRCVFGHSSRNPNTLMTATSNGLLQKWDHLCERLVGEWNLGGEVTCLCMDNGKPAMVFAGMSNGEICLFNTTSESSITHAGLHSPILKICSHTGMFFAVADNGECVTWSGESLESKQPLEQQHNMPLLDFSVHMPHLVFCGQNQVPIITDVNGALVKTIEEVPQASVCATHRRLPVYVFGTETGTLKCVKT